MRVERLHLLQLHLLWLHLLQLHLLWLYLLQLHLLWLHLLWLYLLWLYLLWPHLLQVLLTSMNWLFLTDPATFKPASLPQVNTLTRCMGGLP